MKTSQIAATLSDRCTDCHYILYRYLPGHKLPENVIANPDVVDSVKGANTLVFVTPHQVCGHEQLDPYVVHWPIVFPFQLQFVEDICDKLKDVIPKEGCRAITLVKVCLYLQTMAFVVTQQPFGSGNVDVCVNAGCGCFSGQDQDFRRCDSREARCEM